MTSSTENVYEQFKGLGYNNTKSFHELNRLIAILKRDI